LGGTVNIN